MKENRGGYMEEKSTYLGLWGLGGADFEGTARKLRRRNISYWDFARKGAAEKWRVNGSRANNFAIGSVEIDSEGANCATGCEVRCFGRRANHLFGKTIDISEERRYCRKRRKGKLQKESKNDFERIPGCSKTPKGRTI